MEKDILQIADRLTERREIFHLGVNLNMERHTINAMFTNHPHSITSVANEMLFTWLSRQVNRVEAYNNLGEALVRSNLNMIATEILDFPSGMNNDDVEDSRL